MNGYFDWAWLLVLALLVLLDREGEMQGTCRYSLSAFKYDEDSGRAIGLGKYRKEQLLSEARHYARVMLEENPEAAFVRIYEGDRVIEDIHR